MTLRPAPRENEQPSPPERSEPETAYQLLGRAIAAACSDSTASTVGLHALVVFVVEDARLKGLNFLDLARVLDGWIDLHTQDCHERTRWRVTSMVRHWALAEFIACEARVTGERAVPALTLPTGQSR